MKEISFNVFDGAEQRCLIHVGPPAPKFPLRDLTEEQQSLCRSYNYVKYEEYPPGYTNSSVVGRFYTQSQLEGQCGKAVKGVQYGRVNCPHCDGWFDAHEFVWSDTGERLQ